jgi:hypothetical protein
LDNPKYRWCITAAFSVTLGLIGLCIGFSIDTQHPDDRVADLLLPTVALSILGALIGYVFALVYYRKFTWFDGFVSLTIPFLAIYGFWLGKSGNLTGFKRSNVVILGMLTYLIVRCLITSRKHIKTEA